MCFKSLVEGGVEGRSEEGRAASQSVDSRRFNPLVSGL